MPKKQPEEGDAQAADVTDAPAEVESVEEAPVEGSSDSQAPEAEAPQADPDVFVMPEGYCWGIYTGPADIFALEYEGQRFALKRNVPTPMPQALYDKFHKHWLYADYLKTQE